MIKIDKTHLESVWGNYYIRSLKEEKGYLKIQISSRSSGKVKKRKVYKYSIENNLYKLDIIELTSIIDIAFGENNLILEIRKVEKEEVTEILNQSNNLEIEKIEIKKDEDGDLEAECYNLVLNNKNIEELKDYDIELCEYYKSGLKGKYLVRTIIKDKNNRTIEKEYFCSVAKKSKEEKKIFLHIAHLEKKEIDNLLLTK